MDCDKNKSYNLYFKCWGSIFLLNVSLHYNGRIFKASDSDFGYYSQYFKSATEKRMQFLTSVSVIFIIQIHDQCIL